MADARINALNGVVCTPAPEVRPRRVRHRRHIGLAPRARDTSNPGANLRAPGATVIPLGGQPAAVATRLEANIDQVFAFRDAPYGDIPERLLPTDHPTTLHNEIELRVDGDVFPALFEDLRAAVHSIHIAHFALADDRLGREIEHILFEKVRQGVEVRVLIDAAGSDFLRDAVGGRSMSATGRMLDRWQAAGIEVIRNYPINPSNAAELMNHSEHRKLYIIDTDIGWTGGMGIKEVYRSEWHDTMVRARGEIVGQMQVDFLKTWLHLGGLLPGNETTLRAQLFPTPAVRGDTRLRGLVQIPGESTAILDTFLREINAARRGEPLYIESPYLTDDRILDALEAAARRGADVRLVLPGDSDHMTVVWAMRAQYRRLLGAGVRIYEYPGMTHAKLATRGRSWAMVGSSNLDSWSLNHVYEFNVEITTPRFVNTVGAALARDMEMSQEIAVQDLNGFEELVGAVLHALFSYVM